MIVPRLGFLNNPLSCSIAHLVPIIALCSTSIAQSPPLLQFTRLGTQQGLSHSTVNAIVKDNDGFMWFATQDGLNRFDGYAVKTYRSSPDDTSSLSHNYIWRMIKSRTGDLWLGTFDGGLNRLNPRTGTFQHYRHNPSDPLSLRNDNIAAVYEDRDGVVWVGSWFGGLSRLDSSGIGFVHFLHNPSDPGSLSDNRVASIIVDRYGDLWVGTWNGLNRRAKGSERFVHYFRKPGGHDAISSNMIWDMTEDSDGNIWIATWGGGLCMFERATGSFRTFQASSAPASLGSNLLRSVYLDRNNNLWIGTFDAGLSRLDRHSGSFHNYKHSGTDARSLPDNEVQSVYEDDAGVLWVGTGYGVASYDRRRQKFAQVRFSEPNANLWIRSLSADSTNGIWIATVGQGLFYLASQSLSPIPYQKIGGQPLSSMLVTRVLDTRDGALWIGTRDAGVIRLDKQTGAIESFHTGAIGFYKIPSNDIIALHTDTTGDIWVGTNGGGLAAIDYKRRNTKTFQYKAGDSTSISGNSIWAIHEDRFDNLWVGTWGASLNRLDRSTGRFVRYKHQPADSTTIPANTIFSFAEDSDDNLWIATRGGFALYERRADRFVRFTEQHGLASNTVYGILFDERGNLWMSTTKGLVRFVPGTKTFKTYDVTDGLLSNEFDQGVFSKRDDGAMLFGSSKGVIAFDPDSLRDNMEIPPVVVTNFLVFQTRREMLTGPGGEPTITLDYTENFFSFEYAALDYAAPERNEYTYMLEGLDHDWVPAGNRRFANYTHVSPGSYVFRVLGSNNDGRWNTVGTSVHIKIIPPYWETWWFRSAIALLIASGIYFAYKVRISRLLATERLRLRIARDLHDDVGTNLSTIALASHALERQQAMDRESLEEVKEIRAIAQRTQELMSEIVWMLNPKNDALERLLERMRQTASRMLKDFSYSFQGPEKDLSAVMALDAKRNLFLIYKEVLHNIVKHSAATEVEIKVINFDGALKLVIRDNGVGFDLAEAVNRGNGLSSLQQRADSIGGTLFIDSGQGKGTTVSLEVKIT